MTRGEFGGGGGPREGGGREGGGREGGGREGGGREGGRGEGGRGEGGRGEGGREGAVILRVVKFYFWAISYPESRKHDAVVPF